MNELWNMMLICIIIVVVSVVTAMQERPQNCLRGRDFCPGLEHCRLYANSATANNTFRRGGCYDSEMLKRYALWAGEKGEHLLNMTASASEIMEWPPSP